MGNFCFKDQEFLVWEKVYLNIRSINLGFWTEVISMNWDTFLLYKKKNISSCVCSKPVGTMTSPVTINFSGAQMVLSKHNFPLEGNQSNWGK